MSKTKFKVGDRVRSVVEKDGDGYAHWHAGLEGTVRDVTPSRVGVEFAGSTGGHSLSNTVDRSTGNSGWYFHAAYDKDSGEGFASIEKIKPAKKPGPKHAPQDYRGNGKHKWEKVTDASVFSPFFRLRVPGGWLYGTDAEAPVFVPLPVVDKRPI